MNSAILILVVCFSFSSLADKIHDAAWRGDTDEVISLLKEGHNPNAPDAHGFTVSDIAVETGNTELFEFLKGWGIEPTSNSQSLLMEVDFDKYFNFEGAVIHKEAIVNINIAQESISSPKKRRNSLELAQSLTKKQHTDPMLESTTTSSTTTSSTTLDDNFWNDLGDVVEKPVRRSFDFFALRDFPVTPAPFPVVATLDSHSDLLIIGPYYVRVNIIAAYFSGITLFDRATNNEVASMVFSHRGRLPDANVGNCEFLVFRNQVIARVRGDSNRFSTILQGSYYLLKPVAAHGHVFVTDALNKVVYVIHGTLLEHIATVDVGTDARHPFLVGNYLFVANKGDSTFTVIDISSALK